MTAVSLVPNPASGNAVSELYLPHAIVASGAIINALGMRVAELGSARFEAGIQRLPFDASVLQAGVYFIIVSTSQGSLICPVVVAR